jgi:hypothetical protein
MGQTKSGTILSHISLTVVNEMKKETVPAFKGTIFSLNHTHHPFEQNFKEIMQKL